MTAHDTSFEMRKSRYGGNALLFVPNAYADAHKRRELLGIDVPAHQARVDGWHDDNAANGLPVASRAPGKTLDGVVVALEANVLANADRSPATAGLKRAIAMIELDGNRTWAFLYTRTS